MIQKNYEAHERAGHKFAGSSEDEMRKLALLYRLASWPNLTQLLFMWSVPLGGEPWLTRCVELWPLETIPLYHYSLASAMGYALSMLSETLRDRKLISLETDISILVLATFFPMGSVVLDKITYGESVTIVATDYWVLFGGPSV
jgi:hypothetical protein